ncbi:MAG: ComEA family DNA-binding protein [Planctomycetota bacterium]
MTAERPNAIEGAAKWAAVAVLGAAAIIGVGRSLIFERVHAPPPSAQVATTEAVPRTEPSSGAVAPPSEQAPAAASIEQRINVNTATAAELDLLPGIGPAYAARIIEDRAQNGPYTSADDLQRVRGIGPKTAAKLEPLISFDAP